MRRLLSVVAAGSLALLAGACGSSSSDRDQAGNVYPPGCTAAELASVPAQIVFMDPVILAGINHTSGTRELGVWMPAPSPEDDIMWIDNTLKGWKRDDDIRHERCHSKKYHETGNGQWHR